MNCWTFIMPCKRLGQVAALRKDWSAKGAHAVAHPAAPLAVAGEVEQVIAAVAGDLPRAQQ